MRRTGAVLGGLVLAVALAACTVSEPPDPQILDGPVLPPIGVGFDYQLGGPYDPPAGVEIVARDSTEPPASTGYSICYVNGFQTQPGQEGSWLDEYRDLVLNDASGGPLADPGWPDEYILDTSTTEKRERLEALMGAVIEVCAAEGYDAVEIDNLDSYTRSEGQLSIDDNIALAAAYARVAHEHDLAIAQKNGAGDSQRFRDEAGFDFAVTEECMRYDECDDYLDAYDVVLDIEYGSADEFAQYCERDHPPSMILRDLDLVPAGEPGYVYETC